MLYDKQQAITNVIIAYDCECNARYKTFKNALEKSLDKTSKITTKKTH